MLGAAEVPLVGKGAPSLGDQTDVDATAGFLEPPKDDQKGLQRVLVSFGSHFPGTDLRLSPWFSAVCHDLLPFCPCLFSAVCQILVLIQWFSLVCSPSVR